jgi:hypothetical protein
MIRAGEKRLYKKERDFRSVNFFKSGVDCFCLSVDDQDYICFGFKGGNYYKLSRPEFFDLSREKKIKESEIDDYIKKTIEGDISVSFLLKDNKRKDVLIDKECKYILGAL